MKIVFATNNNNKLQEVRAALPDFEIVSLKEIGCNEDLPETQNTIEGNAQQKAEYVFNKYKTACFADDTGLIIDALNGEPGVYSARYAGPECDGKKNMEKVLQKLAEHQNRKAHFKTVIYFVSDDQNFSVEGIVNGSITLKESGAKGFGYDPIFKPDGYDITFAEMDLDIKNVISHRGKAVKKLAEYLKSNL